MDAAQETERGSGRRPVYDTEIRIKVKAAQRAQLREAAQEAGMPLASWMRHTALRIARRTKRAAV